MSARPFILITNDDGINAKGIKHLWNALKDYADIAIIAPTVEQSAVGMGITIRKPLHIQSVAWENGTPAWSINGTPADCVKLGLKVILEKKPDLVVAGINRGTNAGRNLLYSGTVAGTIESVLNDIPAIAFSCFDYSKPDYTLAEPHIPRFVDYVLKHPLPAGSLFNVNFPSAEKSIKGVRLARQGKGYWVENPVAREHPSEQISYYWLGITLKEFEEDKEADVYLLNQGYVTAVPVHIHELTDHLHYKESKPLFDQFFSV